MNKLIKTLSMLLATAALASCGDDDVTTIIGGSTTTLYDDDSEATTSYTTVSAPDFANLTIAQSTAPTGEAATSAPSRSQSVTITFSPDGTATSSDESLATVSGQTVTASSADVNYILTGTTAEGSSASFNCKATSPFTITLSGVTIHTTAKAISATKGADVTLVIADGTTNTLTSTSKKTVEVGDDSESSDGTLTNYASLDIYGAGALTVTSDAKGAVSSTGAMTIHPGVVLNVTTTSAGKKGIKSDTSIDIQGGRTTVINTGAAEYDTDEAEYSAATCIKAPSITVSGGTVQCLATGNGGKGIRADNTLTVTDGTIEVITTGSNLVYYNGADKVITLSQLDSYSNCEDANPKGIHVGDTDSGTGDLTISGGTLTVKSVQSEGIESKMNITISGGTVNVYAGDDAINAGISSESNSGNPYADKGNITISGGTTYAYSTDNDAIDANGTISISGGVVVASGNTAPECGIDCDQNTFAVTGGYIIGLGGSTSSPTESACTQSSLITTASLTSGDILTLQAGGTTVIKAEVPRTYSSATLLISTPEMKKGTTYAIYKGTTSITSGTLSTTSYVNGSSGGMGGGTFPGGGGGFPGGGFPGGH